MTENYGVLLLGENRRVTVIDEANTFEGIVWEVSLTHFLRDIRERAIPLAMSADLSRKVNEAIHKGDFPARIHFEPEDLWNVTSNTPKADGPKLEVMDMTKINSGRKRDQVPSPLAWALYYAINDPDDPGPSILSGHERIVLVAVATMIERAATARTPASEVPLHQLRKALRGIEPHDLYKGIEELTERGLLIRIEPGAGRFTLPADAYEIKEG